MAAEWWSIEVFHGEKLLASRWKDSYEDDLTAAAVTSGAVYWEWSEHQYGVVFEVCFSDDAQWEAFRALPQVRAALDAVPDPVSGLLVYRGRGGGAGSRKPRKPKPAPGAAALEIEEPVAKRRIRLRNAEPPAREPDPPLTPEPIWPGAISPAARG